MQHTLPETTLEALQQIYRELVAQRDPDATFVAVVAPVEPETPAPQIGI